MLELQRQMKRINSMGQGMGQRSHIIRAFFTHKWLHYVKYALEIDAFVSFSG